MNILIITQYFPPEMGAPQARLFELAKRLKGMGHKLTVLTAMPNYPTGKLFRGYKSKIRCSENNEGIRVTRTCIYPSKSKKMLPKLFSYLSFGLSSVLLGIWGIGRQDVVLVESPPLFLPPFAWIISKITGGKMVMMVSDIWPDMFWRVCDVPQDSLCVKGMYRLEQFCYNRSYSVALTNPGAQRQIQERFPYLKNVTVISNGVDTDMFNPSYRSDEIREKYGAQQGDFLIGYCGLHGIAQGIEVIISAAARLREHKNIKFVLIGDGPMKEDLIAQSKTLALDNVSFFSPVPKSEMPRIVSSMDVSLVPLAGRFPGTMPSKFYEALASGTPPIAAKGCEAELLIKKYDAGRTYEPKDDKELADAIFELADNHDIWANVRNNCVKLAKRFSRDVIAKRTEEVLQAVSEKKEVPKVEW